MKMPGKTSGTCFPGTEAATDEHRASGGNLPVNKIHVNSRFCLDRLRVNGIVWICGQHKPLPLGLASVAGPTPPG